MREPAEAGIEPAVLAARQPPPRESGSRFPWTAIRILISVGLLVFVLAKIDLRASVRVVLAADTLLLAAVLGLTLLDRVLSAYRWYVLLPRSEGTIAFRRVLRLVFVSSFLGYFMPGTVGIEAVRIYGLSAMTSNMARAVASVLVERVMALMALMILVLIGLKLSTSALPAYLDEAAWIGLGTLVLGSFAWMSPRLRRLALYLCAPTFLAPLRRKLGQIFEALDTYRSQPGVIAWATVVAFAFQMLRVLIVYTAALALGAQIGFIHFVVIVPIVFFLTLLPIAVAGIGVQEVSFVYLFGFVGMAPEVALPLSFVMHAFAMVSMAPGAWFYFRRGVAQ